MGLISDLAKSGTGRKDSLVVGQSRSTVRDAVERGRATWRETFGVSKEDGDGREFPQVRREYRSITSSDAAIKRLITAMRSMAPGGWSDDRYEQSKHFVGITYAAVHRTGEQMSQAEFEVFERDDNHPDGKRPVKKGEPGWDLIKLLEKPNEDDSFGDLMYSWNQQLDLTGTALTWMVPNMMQQIKELYPIPTALAIPQAAINPDYPDGYYRIQPMYPYGPFSSYPTPSTAVGAPIPAQWMMRVKYTHPLLRYEGYSPQTALRLHLDEIEQIDRSRWYSMKRAIDPSAVLQFDEVEGMQPLPEEEINRIKAEFENEQMGSENAGRLFVSTPGSRLEPWGGKPLEMEYQSGWEQLVGFALGAGFGITKPAAGMIEDSSYASLFATLKQLHLITLMPKCARIAAKLTRVVAPYFGDNLIVGIRCQRIDDHEILKGKLDLLTQNKAITVNELRRALDWPLSKEQWAEERVGQEPQQQPGMPPGPGAPPAPPGLPGMEQQGGPGEQEQGQTDEQQIANTAPTPNTLNQGSLGPQKYLNRLKNQRNGNGYHKKHQILNGLFRRK